MEKTLATIHSYYELKSGLSKLTCPFISVGKLALRTGLIESAVDISAN
jgi:hypothetical protein